MAENQIAFALEILNQLANQPLKKVDLAVALSDRGFQAEDLSQKITRTIAKLRNCGFAIRSAPNRPYELVESSFPVILSPQQQSSLSLAAYILSDMGFSTQASDLLRIAKLNEPVNLAQVKVSFSPPVDYSKVILEKIIEQLQDRFKQKCRYNIRYRSSSNKESNWDCDLSELRFHNGVLYLFAFIPDFSPRHSQQRPSIEQNLTFRVDRIISVRPASDTRWSVFNFPAEKVGYRMSGPLGYYSPRRANEVERYRAPGNKFVDIETTEDCWFWFRQRILQYGRNVRILEPQWMADLILQEHTAAVANCRRKA